MAKASHYRSLDYGRAAARYDEHHVGLDSDRIGDDPHRALLELRDDLNEAKDSWIDQNHEELEDGGLDPQVAHRAYVDEYVDRARARMMQNGVRPRASYERDPQAWLEKRRKLAIAGVWGPDGDAAIEREIFVREALAGALRDQTSRDMLEESPGSVRSALDPTLDFFATTSYGAFATRPNTVYVFPDELGQLTDGEINALREDLERKRGTKWSALQNRSSTATNSARGVTMFWEEEPLVKRNPPKKTLKRPWRTATIVLEWAPATRGWTPWLENSQRARLPISIRTGVADADEAFRLAEKFLERVQVSSFLREQASSRDEDPVLNPRGTMNPSRRRNPATIHCDKCGREYRPGGKPHRCPEMGVFFDSNRGTSMPQDFADEVKRELVLGVSDEDYEVLAEGDTPENEWIWETWDSVLEDALIVVEPITKGDLVDAILDAEQELAEMPPGAAGYMKKANAIQRLRSELAEEGERVMAKARELDKAGKTSERDALLIEHGALAFTLYQTENGDVLEVPWGMEHGDEDEYFIWPKCADCEKSTSFWAPSPHECSSEVCPECDDGFKRGVPCDRCEARGARKNPARARRNPESAQLEDAKAKFEEFHRKKPTSIGEFHQNFVVPDEIGKLGKAVHVLYRSDKKDPATGKQPKKPVDYIHEHYAGVHCYAPNDELEQVEVPEFVREADALVLLGLCLGFRFKDDEGEHDAEGEEPLPELYATPCGRALIVVQDKREVLAMIWGGGLGVWARGIDG